VDICNVGNMRAILIFKPFNRYFRFLWKRHVFRPWGGYQLMKFTYEILIVFLSLSVAHISNQRYRVLTTDVHIHSIDSLKFSTVIIKILFLIKFKNVKKNIFFNQFLCMLLVLLFFCNLLILSFRALRRMRGFQQNVCPPMKPR